MGNKKISVGHLYYTIIIATIILAYFLVLVFGGTDNANTTMSTASTVSSLILSVIAIVMTIVDVAGQRNTIADLKDSSDKLETSLLTVNTGIDEIREIKEEMLSALSTINQSNITLSQEISELKEKYSKSTEEGDKGQFVKDLEGLSEKINNIYTQPKKVKKYYDTTYSKIIPFFDDSQVERVISFNIRNQIASAFEVGEKFELKDALSRLESLEISRSRLKVELEAMVRKGIVRREDQFYILNHK